jgi:mono/diheme cytochrome c family protein
MKKLAQWIGIILLPIIVIGGVLLSRRDLSIRNSEWPTQMQFTPVSRTGSPNAILPDSMTQQPPVAGTIPRGFRPFHYGADTAEAARAGRELINPLQPTPENLIRGKHLYDNYCAVCHGSTGAGDGPIIPKYPNPPSYKSDASRSIPDGQYFHIITLGRNNMPSHAAQLSEKERWEVILHIRQLQRGGK